MAIRPKVNKKFYAYAVPGGRSGIAASWTACERIVSGKAGARYRGFASRSDAEAWLARGASYEERIRPDLEPGVYFDAGTGRGMGVEVSVTDERGRDLLHLAVPRRKLNKFGKLALGRKATNNYGELMACKYALAIAEKRHIRRVFGDSRLVIDYWTKWHVKKDVGEKTFALAREVAGLRKEFETRGGVLRKISGDENPADLGFH